MIQKKMKLFLSIDPRLEELWNEAKSPCVKSELPGRCERARTHTRREERRKGSFTGKEHRYTARAINFRKIYRSTKYNSADLSWCANANLARVFQRRPWKMAERFQRPRSGQRVARRCWLWRYAIEVRCVVYLRGSFVEEAEGESGEPRPRTWRTYVRKAGLFLP